MRKQKLLSILCFFIILPFGKSESGTTHLLPKQQKITHVQKTLCKKGKRPKSLRPTAQQYTPDDSLALANYTFDPQIHSVKFTPYGFPLLLPILTQNASTPLSLSFDDFSSDVRRFYYKIIACNYDWSRSELSENEYLNGYTYAYIEDYDFSFNTLRPFTHYWLTVPNDQIQITKSGNYVIQVYDDDTDKLILARRFFIAEKSVEIRAQMIIPRMVSSMDTRQELVFSIHHPEMEIRNPRMEIHANVIQNGRWDNAVIGASPRISRPDRDLFDQPGQFSFDAGKEFRNLDLRSFRSPAPEILNINRYDSGFEITLRKDYKRFNKTYRDFPDINGSFAIQTFDFDNDELESDYARVLFSLYSPTAFAQHDVYLFGEFSDWQIKPEFRMAYNNIINGYVAEIELKQGVYNYYYVRVPKDGNTIDLSETEGSWRNTENQYTIFVYYRPFGQRYDRLIAVETINSR